MTRKERIRFVLDWFSQHMPQAETELNFENPFQLLVAVILSAQCTDKRVNLVTPALFQAYPDAARMSLALFDDLNPYIRSVTFANNKTKHLIGMAQMLVAEYCGEVPQTVEALQRLPGVGRKTANVITSVVWSQPNMAVDTHVFRVAARIGLTLHAKNPLQAEEQLLKFIPTVQVHRAHHWLILHGRYVCLARRPLCEQCNLQPACQFFQKEMKYVLAGERKYDPARDTPHKLGATSSTTGHKKQRR
ncbi:MAG: endonuclease III [Bacteroidetes bacterium]|nr:endonuclease III [Bacteroidota bacterium]